MELQECLFEIFEALHKEEPKLEAAARQQENEACAGVVLKMREKFVGRSHDACLVEVASVIRARLDQKEEDGPEQR